jgi:hypothetical protein
MNFTDNGFTIPLRQKLLLGITLTVGLYLLVAYQQGFIEQQKLTKYIFYYSLGVPMALLVLDAFTDLNDNRIFSIWISIAVIQITIYLLTKDKMYFQTLRSPNFDKNTWFNSHMSETTITSLKALFFFLIAYKLFNGLMKKVTGNYLVNTYRQQSWRYNLTGRKFTVLDVVFNILLLFVIFISALC